MDSMRMVQATRIGGHAHRFLSAQPRAGRIVSVFRHGFNILFDEESDPGFASIQTSGVPLHPWAVQVPSFAEYPDADAQCSVIADAIHCDTGLSIGLDGADVCELRIDAYTEEEADVALGRRPLVEENGRTDRRSPVAAEPFQPQIDAILGRWTETGNADELLNLIGLGAGSTPSGDDVLVGVIAGLAAFEAISDVAKATLLGLRLAAGCASSRTPLPSAQMIAAAVDGAFPEPLGNLVVQLGLADAELSSICQLVECVVGQGATSGPCFLLGLTAAQQAAPLSA